jgi:tetratricopeptide (TPR) repeat protein
MLPRASAALPAEANPPPKRAGLEPAGLVSPPRPPTAEVEPDSLLSDAEAAFQRGKFVEALLTAKKAVKHGGGVRAQVILGKTHYRMAQYEEALAAYEKALLVEPGNVSAKRGQELARSALGRR